MTLSYKRFKLNNELLLHPLSIVQMKWLCGEYYKH